MCESKPDRLQVGQRPAVRLHTVASGVAGVAVAGTLMSSQNGFLQKAH